MINTDQLEDHFLNSVHNQHSEKLVVLLLKQC